MTQSQVAPACLPGSLGGSTREGTPSSTTHPFLVGILSEAPRYLPPRSLWLVPALRILPGALFQTDLLEPSKGAETSRRVCWGSGKYQIRM